MNETEAVEQVTRLAESADPGDAPVGRVLAAARRARRRRTRRVVVGAVAATALTTLGTVGVVQVATDSPTTPRPAPVDGPVPPPGTRYVGLGRVVVAVPAVWDTNRFACGSPAADTVYFRPSVPEPTCDAPDDRYDSLRIGRLGEPEGSVAELAELAELVDDGERVDLGEGVVGYRSRSGCTDDGAAGGVGERVTGCTTTLVVPEEDVFLRLRTADPRAGEVADAVLGSARLLPDGWTTVPPIAWMEPSGSVGNRLLGAGLEVAREGEGTFGSGRTPVLGSHPDAGSVVAAGSTVSLALAGPEPMVAVPASTTPGGSVDLYFPSEQLRGVGFSLTSAGRPASSGPDFSLTSDAGSGGTPTWGAGLVPDLGVGGPGPDRVVVPDVTAPGDYRLCTANAADQACTTITVTAGSAP
ncbi:hypothetical protein QWY28_14260 [Nocardioides sp. SOB77]|uniref:PASTA domain-containing protein n=1 Tax=Nocardioides oceani TaxID=3058369 RepID=A0ABT8FIA6_9ACTN|nr:hypothetical protein [Nocardioides oceani]MDN4174122.1 hypothetical protein [Nocardioides oceani]